MALSIIEKELFSDQGSHAITSFQVQDALIVVNVAPWLDTAYQLHGLYIDLAKTRIASFTSAYLVSREIWT